MRAILVVLPCCALLAAAFLGCSGGLATTSSSSDGGDAGGGGDAGEDATPPADGGTDAVATDAAVDPIWPADAEKLVADSPGGGFVPMPPAGSECNYGAQRYTVEIATRAFAFQRCAAGATATDPLKLVKGGRILTTGELATVDAAMKNLTPPKDPNACGADKGVYTVTVTSPRGDATFYDSFYVCQGGGKVYVDNIDGVFEAFRLLAP
jgi:hypothetical protein